MSPSNKVTGDNNIRKDGVLLMVDQDENEPKINIKDLCLSVLKKAGIMLLAGCIIGGALFSYKVIQRVKTNDVLDASTRLSDSETDVQYQLRVQNIEKARGITDAISSITSQVEHERHYIANSIYMQIDPENVYQSTAQVVLSLENNDTAGVDSALYSAYEREIRAGNYLNDYAAQMDTKPDYLKELISFSSAPVNYTILTSDKDVDRVGSMYITVVGPSSKIVNDVMDLVLAEIDNIHGSLNTTVDPHTVTVVGVQQTVRIDSSLRDNQVNHTVRIQTLQSQITVCNDNLDKVAVMLGLTDKEEILSYFAEHEVVDVEQADGIPTETSEKNVSRWSMIKPGLKWGILGFAAGVCIVAAYVFAIYLFGKKLRTQGQFFSCFPAIKRIGVLKPSYKRGKFSAYIETKSGDDTRMSKENNLKLIGANYSNITMDRNKVLITGVGDSKKTAEAVKALGLKGDFKPNIFENPDVLKTVPDYDAIVLVEQRKASLIKDIKEEIDLLNNGGTEIIGAIII